jgi:hypothetical protein
VAVWLNISPSGAPVRAVPAYARDHSDPVFLWVPPLALAKYTAPLIARPSMGRAFRFADVTTELGSRYWRRRRNRHAGNSACGRQRDIRGYGPEIAITAITI